MQLRSTTIELVLEFFDEMSLVAPSILELVMQQLRRLPCKGFLLAGTKVRKNDDNRNAGSEATLWRVNKSVRHLCEAFTIADQCT